MKGFLTRGVVVGMVRKKGSQRGNCFLDSGGALEGMFASQTVEKSARQQSIMRLRPPPSQNISASSWLEMFEQRAKEERDWRGRESEVVKKKHSATRKQECRMVRGVSPQKFHGMTCEWSQRRANDLRLC